MSAPKEALGEPEEARLTVVVPTLGTSPLLHSCLRALRRDAGGLVRLLVVDQAPAPLALPVEAEAEVLRPGSNRGFAGGMNFGFAACTTEYVAAVNDDLVVEAGWTKALLGALDAHPEAAAAQGVNFQLDAPERVDGAGLAFNRWWQAVQRGYGEPVTEWMEGRPVEEVFGVCATAAVYRRAALQAAALDAGALPSETPPEPRIFDEAFGSYYEDVDLACRLRRAGFPSLLVRGARAGHAGSTTGKTLGHRRLALIYGNRYATLARYLGASFPEVRRRMLERDLLDLLRALGRFDLGAVQGILRGLLRGAGLLGKYRHGGDGARAFYEARRFPVEPRPGTAHEVRR